MPRFLVFLAVLAVACQSPTTSQAKPAGAEPKADQGALVARYSGGTITAGDLDGLVKKDLGRMESEHQERLYQTRRQGLDALVTRRLVEEKAKAAGVTPEELLRKEIGTKVGEPTEAEMQALYERAKAGGRPVPPFEQVKADIRKYVMDQKGQEASRAYYDKLRAEAKVEILLPVYRPPRVQVAAEGPSKGPEKAPVTIVEFSDFQCPYCSRAEASVAQVLKEYGSKVRLVYRDFPLPNHENAVKAAEAAHCAGDQGKYWEMHEKLFANQQALGLAALKGYAKDLKLDQARFDKCLDGGEKVSLVEKNRSAGEEAGVAGTPAFFVNGMLLSGAQPVEAFKGLIDAELAQK